MEEEIISLCNELKNKNHCNLCGGHYENGTCIFCQNPGQEIIYLSSRLEKKILENKQLLERKTGLSNVLTALYGIHDMQIPAVSEILQKTNYTAKVLENFTNIDYSQIIANPSYLTSKQYYLLYMLLFSHEISSEKEILITNLLIRSLLEENPNCILSNFDKEKLYLKAVELIATQVIGMKVVKTSILDDNKSEKVHDTLGATIFNEVTLSRKAIHNNEKETFVTIFHECIHLMQYKEQHLDKIVSKKNMLEMMDEILSNILPGYYSENYMNISFEKEAFLFQYRETIDYFNSIQISVPSVMYQKAKALTDTCGDFMEDSNRTYHQEPTTLQQLFDQEIISHPELLQQYPLLNFSYKLQDNQVISKTLAELQIDLENYENGNLKWNGDSEEILAMYQDRILLLSSLDKSI